MLNKSLQGNFLVVLTEGDIIPTNTVSPCPEGLSLETEGVTSTISTDMLQAIYPLGEENTLASIYNQAISQEDKNALSQTLCGVLELDNLYKKFVNKLKEENPTLTPKPLNIVLFGSASLALTILPNRVSHDIDVAVPVKFAAFCQEIRPKSRGAELELLPPRLLQYLGDWEQRASSLKTENFSMQIVHPLDTIMQKLLRTQSERFDTNDKKDIKAIIEKLNPSKETLLGLLIENPARYRVPADKEITKAIKNNTKWFLNTYLDGISYKDLVKKAELTEEEFLRDNGMLQKASIKVKRIPAKNLGDFLRPPL